MTREDAILHMILRREELKNSVGDLAEDIKAFDMAIEALEQKPCEDVISRQAAIDALTGWETEPLDEDIECTLNNLPSVSTEKTWRCKDCKYFEYDSFEKINGMQLIVAHEICSKWADGCKTREDGYCFLFEPKTQEVEK